MKSKIHSALCNLQSAISRSLLLVALVALSAAAASACHSKAVERAGVAKDEWVRSYSIEKADEISIGNREGTIDVEAVDRTTVEVRAERTVHAGTEKTANDLLPKIEITEDIKPGRVAVRTKGIEGILVGVTIEVKYHVKVPLWANVRVQGANGNVSLTNIGGRLIATATNGNLEVTSAHGSVETRVTNGNSTVDVAEVHADPISVRSTNGSVTLTIPKASSADVSMSAVNGKIGVSGLDIQSNDPNGPERGRTPRWRGTMNGGGAPIEVQTVNGSIALSAREPVEAPPSPAKP